MRRVVVAAIAMLAACDAATATRGPRRDPGALVVAKPSDVQGLDPAIITDAESIEVGGLLYEGLARWKPGTTDIEPGLAASWSTSPDGKQWTFELRPGVVFHDGSPLDATAVVYSFERLLDPEHPHYLGEGGVFWRSLFKEITKVTALAPLRVQIEMGRPFAPLLGNLALYPIVSPAAVEKWGAELRTHPVGTGSYELEAWSPGESVVVRRFHRYWGTAPLLERIVFRVVVDARQRLVDLESGAVDIATAILPDEQSFVELHPDLDLHHVPGNDVSYLAFNTQKPPFDHPAVRRAIARGINKEPIVQLAFQARALPADGALPPSQWAYHEPKAKLGYDVKRARDELAKLAIAGTWDPAVRYKLYASSTPRPYIPQPERVARFLQEALAQIGVQTDLVLQPHPAHRKSLQQGEHDLALFGWIGDTGDPDSILYVLLHSANAVLGSATNIAFYRDPGVDKLLVDAQQSTDQSTRTGLYAAVQERVAEDMPWVPIAHSELVVATRHELQGVVLSPFGQPGYARIRRGPAR